jgi:hypothetical protein
MLVHNFIKKEQMEMDLLMEEEFLDESQTVNQGPFQPAATVLPSSK